MAGLSKQKQKLLLLEKMLEDETDEEHSLSVSDIITKLEAQGLKAERKTVYDDMDTLCDAGIDVNCVKRGHSNAYAVLNRKFQLEELYVLVDAVSSCKFLTQKKSKEIVGKIKSLTSRYHAAELERSIFINNRPRSSNEEIYYTINTIHQAIAQKKKLCFKYFYYNEDSKPTYKRNEGVHEVTPLHVVWENDLYYFIAHDSSADEDSAVRTYRVDRMQKASVSQNEVDKIEADVLEFAKDLRGTFSMYKGEKQDITLCVKQNIFNAVIDKFGKVKFKKQADDFYSVELKDVSISPMFWGWLFGFGADAKVTAPANVVKEAKAQIKKLAGNYA